MNRYLLVDSGCGACSSIARQVQNEVDDILTVRSLSDKGITQHLDTALPGWKWEPMVLEVSDDGKDVKAYAGVPMRIRLLQLLGIPKAFRLASIMYQSTRPLVDLQDRRTFLKYGSGVVAGLAVVGLKPLQRPLNYVVETDEGDVTGRYLTGQELELAIAEATSTTKYGAFAAFLMERGYSENSNVTTGFMVESEGRTPVLHVSFSFFNSTENSEVMIKHVRHGSDVEVIMGILKKEKGVVNEMDVYKAFPDRVEHIKTYVRSGNSIIEKPPGTSTTITAIYTSDELEEGVLVDKCNLCQVICGSILTLTCSAGVKGLCILICGAFSGPAAIACAPICYILTTLICVWFSTTECSITCKKRKYCP